MVKHWRISHPELPTPTQFSLHVVVCYRDALSRQVGEAVRIELRGEDLLNSKAEFNRCRIPRMTINKDDCLFQSEIDTVKQKVKVGAEVDDGSQWMEEPSRMNFDGTQPCGTWAPGRKLRRERI